MKLGLYDVLPASALESLTPEDFRLLLCGCQQVDIDTLKKITSFTDESSKLSGVQYRLHYDVIITYSRYTSAKLHYGLLLF